MAVKIDTDARIEKIRVQEQGSEPPNPDAGYGWVYKRDDEVMYSKSDNGERQPLSMKSVVESLSASGTYAASPNTRYFFDISGLPGDRNFIVPAGVLGDEIEVNITTGDDAFELIIKGDTSITINGGSAATEWSRLFISGESVRLVASSATNWVVTHDGRIPCNGKMTLSAADTTNSAGAETLPTWDVAAVNVGDICDLTSKRFNIRRAGNYQMGGNAYPNGTMPLNGTYYGTIKNNTVEVINNVTRAHASGANVTSQPVNEYVCAVDDPIYMYYFSSAANMGINANGTFWIREL